MLNNWNKLHVKLATNCPDFNKDAKVRLKKWQMLNVVINQLIKSI